ncbi:type II secretion system protein [Paenibacillus borealis]|uniref:type II secretion system protein n=1 Tax=Paenibacillus borealis TaxID=160799 RepID=UPI0006943B05|nr:type II secretion system protein [Paenibacillus borealis]
MLAQAIRKKLGKAVKEEKGFTLIELLAVIVILGIIAVIAFPLIGKIITNTGNSADYATARQVYDAARLYVTAEEQGVFDTDSTTANTLVQVTVGEMQTAGYLDTPIFLPSTKEAIFSGTVTFTDGNLTGDTAVVLTTRVTASGTSTDTPHNFNGAKVLKSSNK